MKVVLIILAALVAVVGVMHLFPQINFRDMPKGLVEGDLPEEKPNWVSSFVATDNAHYIAPLKIKSLAQLSDCIKTRLPEVLIQKSDELNIIAYRQSRVFHFVDWLCIHPDGKVVSSATMGYSDLGKNRELVEKIRALCS